MLVLEIAMGMLVGFAARRALKAMWAKRLPIVIGVARVVLLSVYLGALYALYRLYLWIATPEGIHTATGWMDTYWPAEVAVVVLLSVYESVRSRRKKAREAEECARVQAMSAEEFQEYTDTPDPSSENSLWSLF